MKILRLLCALLIANFVFGASSFALNPYSKNAGEAYRKLPEVKKGGTVYLQLLSNPGTLNPFTNYNIEITDVLENIYARLMRKDRDTGEFYPFLAEKLDVSKDHKTLTYTLRSEAIWEDGSPITTDDAEFSFNFLMNPKVEASAHRPYFEGFKFKKIDAHTFQFTVEKPNVNTIDETNDQFVLIQKKQFDGVADLNKAKGVMEPVASGPYRIKSFQRDQKLELERVKNWWGFRVPTLKNQFNFDSIVYRIIPDISLAYEKFVKGEIDVLGMNAELYGNKVKGIDQEKYGKDQNSDKALWASHFQTKAPSMYTYLGWNLKRPIFQSKKTRQALAQLIDYDEIIEKVYHNEALRCFSPLGSYSPNTPLDQKNRAFKFNPTQAQALLKEDGWSDLEHDGSLYKMIHGQKTKFEFTVRYNSENSMRAKIAQILKERFKKAGITLNIQALEYNTLISTVENHDFDAVILSWGKGNLNQDAKQIWATSSWENKGSNYGGYSNPEVDKLIAQADSEIDVQKHFKINQKIVPLIYDDQPYAFLAEIPGFMAAFQSHNLKASKWVMKYDDTPSVWMFHAP